MEKLIGEKVTGMQVDGRVKVLQTASGREIRAKTVIITTVEIHGKERVEGLTVKDCQTGATRRLEVQGVFIEIGLFPQTDFLLDLVETNERGEIKVNRHGQTGVRGIFAAGDATDSHDKQIVIAAGEGAKAALATFAYLVKQV